MQPRVTFNDAWEGVPLEFANDTIEFFDHKLQQSHPLRAFRLFPVAKRCRKEKWLVEEQVPSDLLWVLDFERKKRIRGKTYYFFERMETQKQLDAMLLSDQAAWVKSMKEIGAWEE